jgi:DNA-binding transcriptional MerR regulator
MTEREFTSKEVAELIGIPYPTLDRWLAGGVITCEVPADGTGSRRRFSFRDLVLASLANTLTEQRLRLEVIGAIVGAVRAHWQTDDPADAGLIEVSPDGGTVAMGGLPSDPFDGKPRERERDGWLIRDDEKERGFGALVFLIDVAKLARALRERIDSIDSIDGGDGMERKSKLVTVALDSATAELLRQVAQEQTEGNRSRAVRKLIMAGAEAMAATEANLDRRQPNARG